MSASFAGGGTLLMSLPDGLACDQQKWLPVLRPIARKLSLVPLADALFPKGPSRLRR